MKTAIKVLFLLTGFVAAHAGLRVVVEKALVAYDTSSGHCGCMGTPLWLLWSWRVSDLVFYWPGVDLLSDFLWGSVAVAIYLWAAKCRKAKRASALRAKANAVAAGSQAGVWPPPVGTSRLGRG